MNRIATMILVLALAGAAFAQQSQTVEYSGGTVPNLKAETEGTLDLSDPDNLIFQYASGKVLIPYRHMQSYQYNEEVRHHLGVLPAIAVGLVRARLKNHFIRVTYLDDNKAQQIALFNVPKDMPKVLEPVLQARIAKKEKACNTRNASGCGNNASAVTVATRQ